MLCVVNVAPSRENNNKKQMFPHSTNLLKYLMNCKWCSVQARQTFYVHSELLLIKMFSEIAAYQTRFYKVKCQPVGLLCGPLLRNVKKKGVIYIYIYIYIYIQCIYGKKIFSRLLCYVDWKFVTKITEKIYAPSSRQSKKKIVSFDNQLPKPRRNSLQPLTL